MRLSPREHRQRPQHEAWATICEVCEGNGVLPQYAVNGDHTDYELTCPRCNGFGQVPNDTCGNG